LERADGDASIAIDQLAFGGNEPQACAAEMAQVQCSGERLDKPSGPEQSANERFVRRIEPDQAISPAENAAKAIELNSFAGSTRWQAIQAEEGNSSLGH
jgi:hypothetical protein